MSFLGFLGWHRLKFQVACVTDRGLTRADNQDSYLSLPDFPAFCVADGMGGGDGGAIASRWVCDSMEKVFLRRDRMQFVERIDLVSAVLQKVNSRIRAYADEHFFKSMGTTVVLMFADPRNRNHEVVCHAGDSRLYRLRDGKLEALTRDHTVGVELNGMMSENSPVASIGRAVINSRRNPLSHVLTRAIGVEEEIHPEWRRISIEAGDTFLLCSDGVYDMVDEKRIRDALMMPPHEAVALLGMQVRDAGASDNYTMVCARAEGGR